MRKIVFQMMTTLNGRLDDPGAWVKSVSEEQYEEIDRLYAAYDTVLVGRNTYEEMAAYWPRAFSEDVGTETNRRMARRMNDYKKLVFSRSGREVLSEWNNSEQVVAGSDEELRTYLTDLKKQEGGDIHLSGGASLAKAIVALGLVDEFHFFLYPIVSPGAEWFAGLPDQRDMELLDTATYDNGVVRLHYGSLRSAEPARPESFTELLT